MSVLLSHAEETLTTKAHTDYWDAAEKLSARLMEFVLELSALKHEDVNMDQVKAIKENLYMRYAEGLLLQIPKTKLTKTKRKQKVHGIVAKINGKTDTAVMCPHVAQMVEDIKSLNDLSIDQD